MSGLLSYVFGEDRKSQAINLPSVEVHHIETNPDRRARSLKHLLKANHVNYSVVYNRNIFDNHNAHILSSAYLLGASSTQLHAIYEEQVKELEAWVPSPAELIDNDWVDFLGDAHYQRAYVDFFEDKLAMEYAYNWKKVVEYFMFASERPLVHGLICGLGHPLIQLGYAYEMDSKEIAMEALTLASVQHDFLYKYSSEAKYTRKSSLEAKPLLELVKELSRDKILSRLPREIGYLDLESTMAGNEDVILDYWNAWDVSNPQTAFEDSQKAVVTIFMSSANKKSRKYDFFIVHLLTTSYAVRVLLPVFPEAHRVKLIRQWWLLVLAVLILRGRPHPDYETVDEDVNGRDWDSIQSKALDSPYSNDAHFVKAIRAMKDLANTWGDGDGYYLRAAGTFVDSFRGWIF